MVNYLIMFLKNTLILVFAFFASAVPSFAYEPTITLSTFKSHDGLTLRYGYWKSNPDIPKKGIFFIMEGMAGFAEVYQEAATILTNKGYDVFALDWRGQGGSDRITQAHSLLHVFDFKDYVKDVEDFIKHLKIQIPVHILGISMGGHIGFRFAHDHPDKVKSMILLAPMFEIKTDPYPAFLARGLATCYANCGGAEKFVFGFVAHDVKRCIDKFNERRHGDFERYAQRCELLSKNPHLAVGGPSFGWLDAAFYSTKLITKADYVQKMTTPTLVIISEYDHFVENPIQANVCEKMPRCQSQYYDDGHHNVLMDSDTVRHRFWGHFDEFIDGLDQHPLETPIPVEQKS
jgi:lysophospholipase